MYLFCCSMRILIALVHEQYESTASRQLSYLRGKAASLALCKGKTVHRLTRYILCWTMCVTIFWSLVITVRLEVSDILYGLNRRDPACYVVNCRVTGWWMFVVCGQRQVSCFPAFTIFMLSYTNCLLAAASRLPHTQEWYWCPALSAGKQICVSQNVEPQS